MNRPPATLQISLAPSDYRHARVLLEHQVRAWRGQFSEVLLTVDFHRSAGRFSERWAEGQDLIMPLAQSIAGARVLKVDYGPQAQAGVSAEFFGGRPVPAKDFRGGPFYSYFFGLNAATNDLVLHADSDLLFGGGSPTWLAEAASAMALHPEILFSAPLPGPPADDGRLHSQSGLAEAEQAFAFRFGTMSTRLFLMSRERFRSTIGSLNPARPPSLRNRIKALVEGNPPEDLPEHLLSQAMRDRGLVRLEFLGTDPGMWSLHPPYRCADYYEKLPELIRRVEGNDIPEAQRGDHDINSSLVDWTEAIASLRGNRWWRRLASRPKA
jgi:hypothetical protein